MLRLPSSARQGSRRGLASAIALAVAFAGGSLIGAAAMHSPAHAQAKPKYSSNFVKVYQPLFAIVSAEGGDIASAKAQLPAVHAAVETADDRNAAGNVTLLVGNKLTDPVLQRQGLEMMLASGKIPPEQIGQYHYIVGNLAFSANDFAAARTSLLAGMAAGYTKDEPEAMILESYFSEGNAAAGVGYLKELVATRAAAGTAVPEGWLLRGLQTTYDKNDLAGSTEVSRLLLKSYPTQQNWQKSLQVIYSLGNYEGQELLDMLRLMRLTKAPMERREFVTYIETADPRIMGNEVVLVLAEAVAAGEIESTEAYHADVSRVAAARAPIDRREAPTLAAEGRKSSTGSAAHNAGEVFLSMGSYAEAEEMYALALTKGVEDSNRTLTRLGIVEVHQGKLAEAAETLAKVNGTRAPIAAMWLTYLETQS